MVSPVCLLMLSVLSDLNCISVSEELAAGVGGVLFAVVIGITELIQNRK